MALDLAGGRPRAKLRALTLDELFRNTAHFPLVNILLELLLEGAGPFLRAPDLYVMVGAAISQAFVLARWREQGRERPLLGNLVAPALYTTVETLFEGWRFFQAPHHLAFWVVAILIGLTQQARLSTHGGARDALIVVEALVRSAILIVMYGIYEALTAAQSVDPIGFLADGSHVFFATAIVFLGALVGSSAITAERYLDAVHALNARLHRYSEWLLGRTLLEQAVSDHESLALRRRERAIVFADIRGFTRWSEPQPPETVVTMLNGFYREAERAWTAAGTIKAKLTADEIMLVFDTSPAAVQAALDLRAAVASYLEPWNLELGIGVCAGPVVEGLLGSEDVKAYDVIGDTVNTAKRLCDSAGPGEILVSAELVEGDDSRREHRAIVVKGKRGPLNVCVLAATPVR
ncbi:MAG: adenylate/guanylate cyclase domain-containing protein [Chloroflexota bacterium]|nr:MAG: adenylate/guanylate cyclase domain-containing protein [Chloroflexota bacterium]